MRIAYIAAGAAGTYCGACARDTSVARGLEARGHELQFVTLYTPLKADRMPSGNCPVYYGGINVYLQQKLPFLRHTPGFLDRMFDARWLLDWVERFAIDTKPEDLGEMTVSVLRGRDGRQKKELARLIRHLRRGPKPDVVNITNSLLSAIAPEVKEALGVPIVTNLQGEDVFVERLGSPWADESRDLIRRHATAVDAFVAPSESYADAMASWLAVPRAKIRVIRPGVDVTLYRPAQARPREPFVVGYLSRITPPKGIDVLTDAFRRMESAKPGSRLEIAGEAVGSDLALWEGEERKLREAGLSERFRYAGAPDLDGKIEFLRHLSVFSVPSRYPERQAVASLEAMATGLPVVLSDHPVEREIVSLTGGGVLVAPGDAQALADALTRLRDNPAEREEMGRHAAAGIARHFSEESMVAATLALYDEIARGRAVV